MSYTRFSVVMNHPVAFESLYGRFYSKCSSALVIMGGSSKSKTSMRKEILLCARFAMEDFGFIPLLSDAEMLRVGFH